MEVRRDGITNFLEGSPSASPLRVSVGAHVLLLQELQSASRLTYLFISHSLPAVEQIATRIAVMPRGKLAEVGQAEQVLRDRAIYEGLASGYPLVSLFCPK